MIQNERVADIHENISSLENQVEQIIRAIHKKKRQVNDKVEQSQKEEIKRVFMDRVVNELEKETEKYDVEADNNVLKLVEEKQAEKIKKEERDRA